MDGDDAGNELTLEELLAQVAVSRSNSSSSNSVVGAACQSAMRVKRIRHFKPSLHAHLHVVPVLLMW